MNIKYYHFKCAVILQIFICETPGIWGSLPKGFDHLWNGVVDMYMTYNVADKENFEFDLGKALALFGNYLLYKDYILNLMLNYYS